MTLVGVVMPAFNAEGTIDRALRSVRAQTHAKLEIIVVDDGSRDSTAAIVRQHAQEDPRVRIVPQSNAGVAASRNRGIADSQSEYIAPIDADDLWHPAKIERQLAIVEASPEVGLVATDYSLIDGQDRVLSRHAGKFPRSHQFIDLCRRNFIGNGSSVLMRRGLVDRLGGYDSSLRERGAEGCEDLQLYLQLAERSPIALIREPLTAYRRGASQMSGDVRKMVRSFDLVAEAFCSRRPELTGLFRSNRVHILCWLLNRALEAGTFRAASEILGELLTTRSASLPAALASTFARGALRAARQRFAAPRDRPPLTWS